MAIRKFIVGLVFVIFFSIGAGTVYAGWDLVSTCTRDDGVEFKIKRDGATYKIRKCINGECSWLKPQFGDLHSAQEYVRAEKDCGAFM